MSTQSHVPVLLDEVVAAVAPRDGDVIVDATFGAGGYARAVLEAADCRVVALDRDRTAIEDAAPLLAHYAGRLSLTEARFSTLDDIVAADASIGTKADAVMLDIGVSSMQIDRPERGFSFQTDGPLDMRMSAEGLSAADLIATLPEAALADLLYSLGDERQSRRIARAIVHDRATTPFTTTLQLAGLVARVLKTPRIDGRHAATRTFQALRIAVNDELGELAGALAAAERCLRPGGRLVVVTFHSLEDGIVKRFLRQRSGRVSKGSRHGPAQDVAGPAPTFEPDLPKAVGPGDAETARNPRARSARLRVALRTDAPAQPLDRDALGVMSLSN